MAAGARALLEIKEREEIEAGCLGRRVLAAGARVLLATKESVVEARCLGRKVMAAEEAKAGMSENIRVKEMAKNDAEIGNGRVMEVRLVAAVGTVAIKTMNIESVARRLSPP